MSLLKLVLNNLDKFWDWKYLLSNVNIEIKHINIIINSLNKIYGLNKYDLEILYNGTMYNPNINFDFFEKHIEFITDYGYLSINRDLVKTYIEMNPTTSLLTKMDFKIYYDEETIFINSIVYDDTIETKDVFENGYINIRKLVFLTNYIDWKKISSSAYIKLDQIENNMHLFWRWKEVSKNPNITMDFVIKYIYDDGIINEIAYKNIYIDNLDWDSLSSNPGIFIKDIEQYPELPWNYSKIIYNPNITWEFIKRNLNKNLWHWKDILKADCIDFNYVFDLCNENIYEYLSFNQALDIRLVMNNADKPWNWKQLSVNKFNIKTNKKLYKYNKLLRIIGKNLCMFLIYDIMAKPYLSNEDIIKNYNYFIKKSTLFSN